MWDRGTTRRERWLLPMGVVVVAVWLGFYAWLAFQYLQLFTLPSYSIELTVYVTAIPLVAPAVMILLVGFAIQLTHKGPRVLFVAFVILEVASLAISLVETAYVNSRPFASSNIQDFARVYVSLSLASVVTSAVAAFLLLLLALPARRPVAPLPSTGPPTPSPPTP